VRKNTLWFLSIVLLVGAALGFVVYTQSFQTQKSAPEQGVGPCPGTRHELDLVDNSMVVVSSYFTTAGGERVGPYRGLGFVRNEYVITAAHVINQDRDEEVIKREIFLERFLQSKRTPRTAIARVVYENEPVDFAILAMPSQSQRDNKATFNIASRSDIRYGKTVCFYLHPFSGKFDQTITGTVSRFAPPYGSEAWFGFKIETILARTVPGASGGPVFVRTHGGLKIAGIMRRMNLDPQDPTLTMQLQATDVAFAVREILRKTGIDILEP